ncbi:MAG: FecR domain-containing protein [Dyadobacter sp.]|uniref:FecR family protein n=1 Tax=Dyadobacter sp. TaxID=1914288 RepID=UPI003263A099
MSKHLPDYSTFSVTDFVLDHHFVQWVQNPSAHDIFFWEDWLRQHPDKQKILADARLLVNHVRFEKDYNSQENIDETWEVLSAKFDEQKPVVPNVFFNARFFMRFAATVAAVGITAGFVWYQVTGSPASYLYKTGNGEVATFKLSDSSEVTLNANSQLKVTMRQGWNASREASLEGEAFFIIKKQKSHTSFTVHTSNVDVNVLGTEFNVSDRRDLSTVVLQSGQIKISNTIGRVHEMLMKPGDLAAFADTSSSFRIRLVNPENYNSWIHKKLVFDHTSISDVAHMLEDNYGFSVVISKPALAKRTFSATLPSNSLPILLKALEESFNLNITQLDKKLTITDK